MLQLRVARADSPTDPAEHAHVMFSAVEARGGSFDDWFVGRDRTCRMCIADASVSRRHLQVIYRDGVFYLRNVSQFGSQVEGRALSASDPPIAVRGNLTVNVGKIGLRCTLLGNEEAGTASMPSPLAQPQPPAQPEPIPDWQASSAPDAWVDSAATPFSDAGAGGVPSVSDLYGSAPLADAFDPFATDRDFKAAVAVPGVGREVESIDWTSGLASEQPLESQPVAATPESPSAAPADSVAVVANIFRGAGLRPDIAELYAKDCTPEKVGVLLAQLLEGLIATLATRRSVKNTLRVAHTEMRVEGNNALKHALTPAEALIALVQADRPGYLGSEAAIRSVFKDMAEHELALVDGMEGALRHVVDLMNPEAIEHASAQPETRSVLPLRGGREARFWGQYRARFGDLFGDKRAFNNQFLPAFRDAYDACLAKLRRSGR